MPSELHRLLVDWIVFKSSSDAFPPRVARPRFALQQLLDLGDLSFERVEPCFYGLGRHPYSSTAVQTISQRSATDTARRFQMRQRVVSGAADQTVRVWHAASGECREVIQGRGDVEAIAAGPSRFPFRALRRGLETVVEDAATAAPVAWFPVPLEHIKTFPNGRTWVGASANHLYIISLENRSEDRLLRG
ncbi:MAG: hypothetical protein HY699_15295 [Deltaproteobacteria bacterium]|nr:hypothetical protein [Deltaproteobacteria bacterium]